MYDKTITVLNCLKKAVNGVDLWQKTVITNAEYYTEKISSINGTTVNLGETVTVLIPFNKNYLPFSNWKTNRTGNYTMSQGDLIILGGTVTETVTASNIITVKNTYNSCEVKTISEREKKNGAKIQLKVGCV